MSVVIKSNNVAKNHFGTSKMLGTSPDLEFQKYKSRVINDGGHIKDEARTLKAFELLFNAKCYGNMVTYVSGSFGVKFSSNNNLSKLYALDGDDLTVKIFGAGSAPKLDQNNCIDFSANPKGVGSNGSLFTTAKKNVLSKGGNFGFGVKLLNIPTTRDVETPIAGATWHDDRSNNAKIINLSTFNEYFIFFTAKPPFNPAISNVSANAQAAYRDNATVVFMANTKQNLKLGYRGGSEVTRVQNTEIFREATTEGFYLDFGGVQQSYGTMFNNIIVSDLFFANHLAEDQAKMLSAF